MSDWINKIGDWLQPFKRKYYLNLLVRGALMSGAVLLTYFLLAAAGEHVLWFGSWARFLLLLSFITLLAFCYVRFLHKPLRWFLFRRGLPDSEAARLIGKSIQSVDDRLVNMIQLAGQQPSDLARASLLQRFDALKPIDFSRSVDLKVNRKYLPFAVAPLVILVFLLVWNSSIITASTERIVNFSTAYVPEAPFRITLRQSELEVFRGEDFTIEIELTGRAVPEQLLLEQNGLMHTMAPSRVESGVYSYTFEKLQTDQTFRLYGAGFYSTPYTVRVIDRPELNGFTASLDFPAYLGMRPTEVSNNGNLEIPEGTRVTWNLQTIHSSKAWMNFGEGPREPMQSIDKESFKLTKGFFEDQPYGIVLANDDGENKEEMTYRIRVIPDEYPSIQVKQGGDSLFFRNIYLGGAISDDHGLTGLDLRWNKIERGQAGSVQVKRIPINPGQSRQNFVIPWSLDSLELKPGDQLEYQLEVWDNDGIHGRKSTRTGKFVFAIPTQQALDERVRAAERETSGDIRKNLEKAKTLSESIEEAQQKLRGKQSMDWQDKAMIEEILRQKQEMEKALEELQKENDELNRQRSAFDEQDERIREKTEQLQQLMEDLLDEETKKLFRELEKLLKENANPEQMQKMLDKIQRNEINIEKELDRIKELFKQLQLEARIDQSINRMDETIRKQEELMKNTPEGRERSEKQQEAGKSPEDQARQQENIRQDLNDTKEEMKELEKMAEEAGEELSLPEEQQFDQTEKEMKESEDRLKKGENQKSKESQKRALDQMKRMKDQLSNMQNSMEMEMDEQNMESLRQILHGLLKLSFDQESTLKSFTAIQTADPVYLTLSQHQLKLQDDAKVLEDSLLALGKKDMALGSFITREIGNMNHHMERASENIRERRKAIAASEMQLSMTSMNNLALMLNDHFQQMMDMMSKPGKGKGKKKGKKQGLAEMQKQLNEQIEQLKNGGKSGRQLSEELARMAAEQERIRKALQNLQEQMGEKGGKIGNDIPAKMEQTEIDLVNKRITEQTIRRQKEILTRLLEAEKSMREQEFDQERKGETAKEYEKEIPKAFQEYLKMKELESELLRSVPPKLIPYYKKEVDAYFERLGKQKTGTRP